MSGKYKNKYWSISIPCQNWDYGWNAAYFITVCTNDRLHYLGKSMFKIANRKMQLSQVGIITGLM